MEARELRIDNYIKDEDGIICKVKAIDSETTFFQQSVNKTFTGSISLHYGDWKGTIGRWVEKCNPIPLDEEWLLKLDFKR